MSRYRVQNPATGEVVETFAAASDEQIPQALANADAAYGPWRKKAVWLSERHCG